MKAFHGDKKIKQKYLARVKAHERMDEIVQGYYWEEGKGCAVGCTIHGSDHKSYETELGIPRLLARLEDGIFEGLSNEDAKTWPRRFLSSIKVGADLSQVWPKFAIWLLTDPDHGVINFAKTEESRVAIQSVSDLYSESLTRKVQLDEWRKVRASAADAYDAYALALASAATADAYAYDATYDATYAAYALASAATAYAYAYSAATAAAAAATADAPAYAATYAARRMARKQQAEKLLELLREAR